MTKDRVHVKLPCGKGFVEADVPNCLTVVETPPSKKVPDVRQEIIRALHNPIASKRLKDLAIGKKNAAIVVNDITRPYAGGLMVEEIANELHLAGMTDEQIFLVVAYGTHRVNTPEELIGMFGEEVCKRFRIVHHHAEDDSTLKIVGKTPSGMTVQINKEFAGADLKITTGLISPHALAGFSGGRKSIVPGISGYECLRVHHSPPIDPCEPFMGGNGMDGNPFHEEALAAARVAGVDFILNSVDNERREMVMCVAGDLDKAHRAGCEVCAKITCGTIPTKADVVICTPGGFPRDIDLHQAQKAVSVAETACKRGGHIILVADAPDKGAHFAQLLIDAKDPQEVYDLFKEQGMAKGYNRGKAFMWARGILRYRVSITDTQCSKEYLNSMFLNHYNTVQDAIEDSLKIYGDNAKFVVIPYAADIYVKVLDEQ